MKQYNLPKRLASEAMRQADSELREQHEKGIFGEGDPNNPKYNDGWNYATGQYVSLFGYDQNEFMAKQYQQGRADNTAMSASYGA